MCVPIGGQILEASALITESFDLELRFHWLKTAARCVPIGQYLKASALIAESFDLVHEALLILVALSQLLFCCLLSLQSLICLKAIHILHCYPFRVS
jgi:hypothetical protein